MSIEERLQDDLKAAMRGSDKQRVSVIRMARAALQTAHQEVVKQRSDAAIQEIRAQLASQGAALDKEALDTAINAELATREAALRAPLDEAAQEAAIAQEIKRRHSAAEIFRKSGHEERAVAEEEEARILLSYLPQQLSADELRPQVAELIAELGLSGPAAMGKLMPALMERFKGRAEGRVLSQLARELLAGG
jgi:uncharacterized protein YqeY